MIHPTAIVSANAQVASSATIGPGAVVEAGATIDEGCVIGAYTMVATGAHLKKNVSLAHGAVVGTPPQDLKYAGEPTTAIVGEGTVIREYATVNRGTVNRGETTIGAGCLLMAYSHVAHDCIIGNQVILANAVNLAGHVEVDDFAIIGGIVPVHQFVKIGKHAMIGGGFRVPQDICPFALVAGYPLKVVGLNVVGLRRRGFPNQLIHTLEDVFKILFFSDLNTTQAVTRIEAEIPMGTEVREILNFITRSNRGIVK